MHAWMCSVFAHVPKCIAHTLEFIIWDVILSFSLSSLSPTLCSPCPMRCSTPDFGEATVMARAELRRASRRVWKGSLAFWSLARLRAGRKDLKNQLPEIITFSEEQQVSHGVEPPPVHSPPLHQSARHWNHTQTHRAISACLQSCFPFLPLCPSPSVWDLTCSSDLCRDSGGLCPPRSAEGGGSVLLRLPSIEETKEDTVRWVHKNFFNYLFLGGVCFHLHSVSLWLRVISATAAFFSVWECLWEQGALPDNMAGRQVSQVSGNSSHSTELSDLEICCYCQTSGATQIYLWTNYSISVLIPSTISQQISHC